MDRSGAGFIDVYYWCYELSHLHLERGGRVTTPRIFLTYDLNIFSMLILDPLESPYLRHEVQLNRLWHHPCA